MSGRKQHFIQRLLLKGFAVDPTAKTPQVWVYARGRTFLTSLERYGAERDFYGDPKLDAAITKAEAEQFDRFLNDAREGDRMLDADAAATFAVQVFARSKNLRTMVGDAIEPMMAQATAQLRDPEFQVRMLVATIGQSADLLTRVLMSGMTISEFARARVRQRSAEIGQLLDRSLAGVRDAIAAWQNQTLRERLDFSGSRREQLRSLHWCRVTTAADLILGDSIVWVELADGAIKQATEPGDALARVCLPVASRQLLVGAAAPTATAIDVDRMNHGSASCSYDAFCGCAGPEVFKGLAASVRTRTFALSAALTEKVVSDALARLV